MAAAAVLLCAGAPTRTSCVPQINLLPVVEAKGSKVVGILTRHDILRGIYAQPNPLL
jgi:CBS domain-containing protein